MQIKIFNDVLDQLFEYMGSEFPYFRSDLVLTKSVIDTVRKSNPRLVVEQFLAYIAPYEKQIMDCDEDFFMNFENNMSLDKDNIMFGMKLRSMWLSNMIQDEKQIIRQKATVFMMFMKLLKIGKTI